MMSASSARAPLWIAMLTLFCVFSPAAVAAEQSEAKVIMQVTEKGAGGEGDVCARSAATSASCPINCFRADPVCGIDGVTYWCGCADAACHGTTVAKLGACEVGSGGSASLPGQALLLVHIVWLFLLGFSLLFGLF